MKPYYQDSSVSIFLGDSEELLPSLPPADIILTDPPYGMNYQSARRTSWQRKPKIHGDDAFPMWVFDLKPAVALFVWCRWDNLKEIPKPKSFIVWDKCRHGMGDLDHEFGRQWEAVAFYPMDRHSFVRRPVDVIRAPCVPPAELVHPNEKPVGAILPLILAHPEDCLIVDPFMGSGTTLRAAKDVRRKAIGIDIDEAHCETAAKRMAQEVFTL